MDAQKQHTLSSEAAFKLLPALITCPFSTISDLDVGDRSDGAVPLRACAAFDPLPADSQIQEGMS